jgi:hypothetical protein
MHDIVSELLLLNLVVTYLWLLGALASQAF